jgi:hypothetical protein
MGKGSVDHGRYIDKEREIKKNFEKKLEELFRQTKVMV